MALCQDSMLMVLDAELFPLWFFGQLFGQILTSQLSYSWAVLGIVLFYCFVDLC